MRDDDRYGPAEDLHPARIDRFLEAGASIFRGRVVLFDRVDSTNAVALKACLAGAAEGTVIVAAEQTAGAGRKGRRWFSSPAGSLVFSIILRPSGDRENLTTLLALAAAGTLESRGCEIGIKWPNDLFAKGRKIAGILAEGRDGDVVLGMGIDVNEEAGDFPGEIASIAVSLRMITGMTFDRGKLMADILGRFNEFIRIWSREGFGAFKYDLESRLLFRGEDVLLDTGGEVYRGTLSGLNSSGYVVLKTDQGDKVFSSGDLSLRKE